MSFGYAKFKWNGGRAKWIVRAAIADGLERAGEHVKRTMKRLVNVPFPPASVAGESPHRRSGDLYKSLSVWIDRKSLKIWVGPSDAVDYGFYLEEGTRYMDARPYIQKALEEEKTKVMNTINRAAAIAFNKYGRAA